MFYKTGVDKTKAKSMFNFLTKHFRYSTLNSWNGLRSIANCVKIYRLNLDGDCWQALHLLEDNDYLIVNEMLEDWAYEHKGYEIGFNGRSGGYLVMYNHNNSCNILPDWAGYDYDEFKSWCKEYYGSVKNYMSDLVFYTELVQSFDKLCDEIRDYVNELSKISKNDLINEMMEEAVTNFNEDYEDDMNYIGFDLLTAEDGKVCVKEISQMRAMLGKFIDYVVQYLKPDFKYVLENDVVSIQAI